MIIIFLLSKKMKLIKISSFFFMWSKIFLIFLMFYNITSLDIIKLAPFPDDYDPILGGTLYDIKDYYGKAFILTQNELFVSASYDSQLDEPEYWSYFSICPSDRDCDISDEIRYTFQKNTVFASYEGGTHIFAGCSSRYLISVFTADGLGDRIQEIYKGNILDENEICSISYLNSYVFLVYSNNNVNKLYFYKIRIQKQNNLPYPNRDKSFSILNFQFSWNFTENENFRYFYCETIFIKNLPDHEVLVCGFVKKDSDKYMLLELLI